MDETLSEAKNTIGLWEISIVVALRDMQWRFGLPGLHPEPYLPISGDFERSGADAALKITGRLFFFELKGDRSKIKDEWSKKRGSRKSKLAYRSALRAMMVYGTERMPAELPSQLHQSLQCHHFVYWSALANTGGMRAGRLVIEPYLLATISEKLSKVIRFKEASNAINNSYRLGLVDAENVADDPPQARFFITQVAPLTMVGARQSALIRTAFDEQHYWSHLGLEFPEFQKYLHALFASQGHAHHPINAVVMSDDGTFFQHVIHTSQLEAIFFPKPSSAPVVQDKPSCSKLNQSLPAVVVASKDIDLRTKPELTLLQDHESEFRPPRP
jgi:hypothetical protein